MNEDPKFYVYAGIESAITRIFGVAGFESFVRHNGLQEIDEYLTDFQKRVEMNQQRKDRKEMWEDGYEPVVGAFMGAILRGDLLPNPERTENSDD